MAEPQWFLRSLHELEPQGSHVRFRHFSAGSGLPNLGEPRTYADCHRDADAKAWTDTAAAPNSATAPVIATLAAKLKQRVERGAAARSNYNSTANCHASHRKRAPKFP